MARLTDSASANSPCGGQETGAGKDRFSLAKV